MAFAVTASPSQKCCATCGNPTRTFSQVYAAIPVQLQLSSTSRYPFKQSSLLRFLELPAVQEQQHQLANLNSRHFSLALSWLVCIHAKCREYQNFRGRFFFFFAWYLVYFLVTAAVVSSRCLVSVDCLSLLHVLTRFQTVRLSAMLCLANFNFTQIKLSPVLLHVDYIEPQLYVCAN